VLLAPRAVRAFLVIRRRRAQLDDSRIPLLSKTSRGIYPAENGCPACGQPFSHGFAYMMGGAILLSKDRQNSLAHDRLEGFLHIGFHGSDADASGSADILVVDDVVGGQFDLQWCSVRCMRAWLTKLLDTLEADISREQSDA